MNIPFDNLPNLDSLPPEKRQAIESALQTIENASTVVRVMSEQLAHTNLLVGLLREYNDLRASLPRTPGQ